MVLVNRMLLSLLTRMSGNEVAQKVLKKLVNTFQHMMGIGSGGAVSTSGEQVVLSVLLKKYKPPYCIFDVGANKGQFLGYIRISQRA